jgi:hypothetical protein
MKDKEDKKPKMRETGPGKTRDKTKDERGTRKTRQCR